MNKEFIIVDMLSVAVLIGLFAALFYNIHEVSECKKAGIAHNTPYLEIKELCQ